MKVLGIIVEYNPFHNGHLYHLEQSKKMSGAGCTVAVMSSNFIQRGEPAIVDKWSRAEMALLCEVDLVLELPVPYSMASAEFFGFGAVKILDSLGIIDYLCFGSENGRIDELKTVADILHSEPESYRLLLKDELNKGLSFPSARENALARYVSSKGYNIKGLAHVMSSSNNILGIEYLKALKKLDSKIVPLTISRIANAYNSEKITGEVSSATSIRKHVLSTYNRDNCTLEKVLPPSSLSVLNKEFEQGKGPVFPSHFERIIMSIIRRMSAEQIKDYPFISEGLENRIKQAADNSGTFEELLDKISTRRYTRTRIQRTLFNFLIGINAHEFLNFNKYGGPQYIRVLGFNSKGRKILSEINKKASLPVVVKTANFKNSCNPLFRRMIEIEARATDMYVLAYDNPNFRIAGQEYTHSPVII